MRKKKNKNKIILITLTMAIFLLSIIGITFAYFTANIKYVNEPSEVIIKSKLLEITFKRENEIYYENLMPGRPGVEAEALNIEKNTLKFSVTSDEHLPVRTSYNVYFNITENTFLASKNNPSYSNVVYILNGVPGKTKVEKQDENGDSINLNSTIINSCDSTKVICGDGQFFDSFNTILHKFAGDLLPTKLGQIEAGKTGRVKIGTAVLGAYGTTDNWEFEIWVNETGEKQNEDMNKKIKGYIEIDID